MFNVTVLRLKDIIKYVSECIIIIILIVFMSKILSFKKNKIEEVKMPEVSLGSMIGCLDKILPTVSGEYNENNEYISENKYLQGFLKTEISSLDKIKEIEKIDKDEEQKSLEEIENITIADTNNINTEVVTQNPITDKYNVNYEKVRIKNETSYTLTEDMLKPDISIENKNILIFHTHSCESYTSSEKYSYIPTGNYRTTDLNYSVTRVGTELENYLKKYNLNVIHDKSYHDYPAYNGSYTRSLETVEKILKDNKADIIIDLHRDAIGSREDYAPTVKINDDYCAQIMFVIRYK